MSGSSGPGTKEFAARLTRCRSCGKQCVWTKARPAGNPMLVDAAPADDGNVTLAEEGGEVWATVHGDLFHPDIPTGVQLFKAHFATCPQADIWRKKR